MTTNALRKYLILLAIYLRVQMIAVPDHADYHRRSGCLACHFGIPDHFPLQPGEAESLPTAPPAKNESCAEAGECLSGVPNCKGHGLIDGKVEIRNHPLGHVIIYDGGKS